MSAAERARRRRFRVFMDVYHCSRRAWELAAEVATAGYPAELADYRAANPAPTFKAYLLGSRGMAR